MTHIKKAQAASILALVLVGASTYQIIADPQPPAGAVNDVRVDAFGDPLPSGAQARLGTLRWWHSDNVSFVAYSLDGKEMITACADGLVRVWEVASGKELRRFGKRFENVNTIGGGLVLRLGGQLNFGGGSGQVGFAVSSDRKVVAVSGTDGTIRLYDVAQGNEIRNWRPAATGVAALLFAPDGKSLFAKTGDSCVYQHDVETGREIRMFGTPPNAQMPFGGGQAGGIFITPEGKTLLVSALALDIQNQGKTVVKRYEVESGKELEAIQAGDTFGSRALSPDGKTLAWSDKGIHLWDLAAGKEKQTEKEENGQYQTALAFSPDGKLLVGRGYDLAVRVWDAENGKELRQLSPPSANGAVDTHRANNFAFSTDGKSLAVGTASGLVRQWDVGSGKELAQAAAVHHGPVDAIGISPDGKTVATRAGDTTIRLWDTSTGKESRSFELAGASARAVFSADGQTMAILDVDGTVHTFDVKAGQAIKVWEAPKGQTRARGSSIAIAADGKRVAVVAGDEVRIYDARVGGEPRKIVGEAPVQNNGGLTTRLASGTMQFSPDGHTLITWSGKSEQSAVIFAIGGQPQNQGGGGNASITLYDVASGKLLRKLSLGNRTIGSVACSPDGRTIAVASNDRISLWEIATGTECFSFPIQGQAPSALVFTPAGQTLIATGEDLAIHCYSVRSGKELAQFAGHLGGVVTLAVSSDGKTLVSGSLDTTALVWSLAGIKQEKVAAVELDTAKTEALWNQLANTDSWKARVAIRLLSSAPEKAVLLLKGRIKPVPAIDGEKIKRLVQDLDSDRPFVVRQKATDELEKLGELAFDALTKALADKPSLEVQMRAEHLLERLVNGETPPADALRALRALQVLEETGTPEARQVVAALAQGASGATLTRKAQETLNRMAKQ